MKNNSVSLHRVIKASPEKLFKAFSNPVANSTWFPPYGFLCTVQQMDFKVGGKFKMTFTNFSTGNGHSFGGEYLDIKPNEYIKYTDKFDDPNQLLGTNPAIAALSSGFYIDNYCDCPD